VFFTLSTWQLAIVLTAIAFGATLLGLWAGRSLSVHKEHLHESLGIVQGALLTLIGLVLAFGLAMAVGRYDSRRDALVDEVNAITTSYLRAQTLHEPVRSRSLPLFRQYTDASLDLSRVVPDTEAQKHAIEAGAVLQRRLWRLAGESLAADPEQSAPRLYVESLNSMIDARTTRVSALDNRVPSAFMLIEVIGVAVALALLALYVALFARGVVTVLLAAGLLTLLLFVSFDLDRPARGFIKITTAPLAELERTVQLPPAAQAPGKP
jgi:hypothetical protein